MTTLHRTGFDSSPAADTLVYVIATGEHPPSYLTRDGVFSEHIERARRFFLREEAVSRAAGMRCPWRVVERRWNDFS